jgi:hypothetical protein
LHGKGGNGEWIVLDIELGCVRECNTDVSNGNAAKNGSTGAQYCCEMKPNVVLIGNIRG